MYLESLRASPAEHARVRVAADQRHVEFHGVIAELIEVVDHSVVVRGAGRPSNAWFANDLVARGGALFAVLVCKTIVGVKLWVTAGVK